MHVWERNSWFARTPKLVIIKLIQLVFDNNSCFAALLIEIGAIVLKSVKVLGYTGNQLLEARVGGRASPKK